MKLESGKSISHYKILSEIGKGGMGTVYLAQDTKLERKVAIKFLSGEWAKDRDKLKRFQQEAKAASALNHPNILTIYEIDEVDGMPYISSEYINGTDIGTFIREEKISLERALDIAIQIAAALKTAHDAGIVHRDIKPENVMIRADGIIKILDFGLAKLTEKEHGTRVKGQRGKSETLITGSPASPKTMPGMVMGTANYMSPEQARGRPVDQRADVFSFGALIYEMLTRVRPFDGETTSDVIAAVLTNDPAPVKELNAEIPVRLGEIVDRSLRKNKKERFQTTASLLEELETLKKHLQIEEIEKTILPEERLRKTKIFHATTVDVAKQTTADQHADSIVIRKSLAGKVIAAVVFVLLAGVIGFFGWRYFGNGNRQIDSIAVMPFVNESKDKEVEYISDGMTETLISSISQIPGLAVKARSTVFYYKGKNTTPKAIGEELNVQAVLLGRVVQQGDDIRLSLELVNTSTQDVIWSDQFTRKSNDLVSLQSEITKQVSDNLASRLTGEQQEKVTKNHTVNADAYKAYLRGRFYWNKRTTNDLEKGVEYFREAIEFDPNYALAWSGLADSYLLLPEYSSAEPKVVMPKAREAAEKAIELDPNLAEGHASLAYVKYSFEWDFARAEREFKEAIRLNPNYATAYQWYGEYLANMGRPKEGIRMAKRAVELDPLSGIKLVAYGIILLTNEQIEEAITQFEKALEVEPDFPRANQFLAISQANLGMKDEALANCAKAIKYDEMLYALCPAYAYAKAGDSAKVQELMSANASRTDGVKYFDAAAINALLGNDEKAFEAVEALYEGKGIYAVWAIRLPSFRRLKDDQRTKDIMKRIGIPE